jgi:hypothetical protein
MGTILPTFVAGQPLSAAQLNLLSGTLTAIKAVADQDIMPFREWANDTRTGYIQHQYNTLHYQTAGAGVVVTYNGTALNGGSPLVGTGTVDLTSLSLTVGQVYPVIAASSASADKLQWLAERTTPSYTTTPTFSDGVAFTAADLNNLVDNTDLLINLANRPPGIHVYTKYREDGWNRNDDSERTIYTGWFRYTGDNFKFRFYHKAKSKKGQEGNRVPVTRIEVNGTQIYQRRWGDPTEAQIVTQNDPQSRQRAEYVFGTVDISGLSLTAGTLYKVEFFLKGAGTERNMDLTQNIFFISTTASGATWSNLPQWAHEGTNVSAARMNLYSTAIDRLFPGSGSETSPVYYDNPAQFPWDNQTKRFMRKSKKFLIYRWSTEANSKPEIFTQLYNGFKGQPHALKAESGTLWVDLDKIGLGYGALFAVDDVGYAVMTGDVSQL